MKKYKQISIFLGISVAAAVLLTGILYYVFPRFLCYSVFAVSENDGYSEEKMQPAEMEEYTEEFIPANNYIKEIDIHVQEDAKITDDPTGERLLYATLLDAGGSDVVKDKIPIEKGGYIQFKIEKWVKAGQKYQLKLMFENCEDILVTLGEEETKPMEHQRFMINDAETKEILYMRYVYGGYSKKLLFMWFISFWFMAGALLCCKKNGDGGI